MKTTDTHKVNKRSMVKMIESFLMVTQRRSLIISIFIFFEIFPAVSHKKARNTIEDKKPFMTVTFKQERKGISHVVKKQNLSIIGSTEKHIFFYNHADRSRITIPENTIISIEPEPFVKTVEEFE